MTSSPEPNRPAWNQREHQAPVQIMKLASAARTGRPRHGEASLHRPVPGPARGPRHAGGDRQGRRPVLLLHGSHGTLFSESILGQIPDVDDSRTKSGLPLLQENDERYSLCRIFPQPAFLADLHAEPEGSSRPCSSPVPSPARGNRPSPATSPSPWRWQAPACCWWMRICAAATSRSLFDVDGRFGLSTILRDEMPWRRRRPRRRRFRRSPSSRAARSPTNPANCCSCRTWIRC